MCYRTGKHAVCRRVPASFSPEMLQAWAVKGLILRIALILLSLLTCSLLSFFLLLFFFSFFFFFFSFLFLIDIIARQKRHVNLGPDSSGGNWMSVLNVGAECRCCTWLFPEQTSVTALDKLDQCCLATGKAHYKECALSNASAALPRSLRPHWN